MEERILLTKQKTQWDEQGDTIGLVINMLAEEFRDIHIVLNRHFREVSKDEIGDIH